MYVYIVIVRSVLYVVHISTLFSGSDQCKEKHFLYSRNDGAFYNVNRCCQKNLWEFFFMSVVHV